MESSLDIRLQSNKVVIISSVSSDGDDGNESQMDMSLLDKLTGLPCKPGCYEEHLSMGMLIVDEGRTQVQPGSATQPHPNFLTLFLSPTTSPSSRCHHHYPPPPEYDQHLSNNSTSKRFTPNQMNISIINDDDGMNRFRFLEKMPIIMKRPKSQIMKSF